METKHKRALMVLGVIVAAAIILYLFLSSRGVTVFRDGNILPSLTGVAGLPEREANNISYNMPAYVPPPFPGSYEGGTVAPYQSGGNGCCSCLKGGGGLVTATQFWTGLVTPYGPT